MRWGVGWIQGVRPVDPLGAEAPFLAEAFMAGLKPGPFKASGSFNGCLPCRASGSFKASVPFKVSVPFKASVPFEASDPVAGSGALKGISAFQREWV